MTAGRPSLSTATARARAFLAFSRFRILRSLAAKMPLPPARLCLSSAAAVSLLAGGDVCLDTTLRDPRYLGAYVKKESFGSPRRRKIRKRLMRLFSRNFLLPGYSADSWCENFPELLVKTPENEKHRKKVPWTRHVVTPIAATESSKTDKYDFPFAAIRDLFQGKDLVFLNLETPLSDNPRVHGFFCGAPPFAKSLRKAGVDVVSLANNHIFDAGEIGFAHTLENLAANGIAAAGAGADFAGARRGTLIERKGIRFLFLAYSQFCIHRHISFAADYSGILPLDRQLMREDVQAARDRADIVIVSLHWGFENEHWVHPAQVEIAHQLIDAGADALIGHHSHLPQAIEIYRQRPIVYSLGNLIFGYSLAVWGDNILTEFLVDKGKIAGLRLYPVSGRGDKVYQPELLRGEAAEALLRELQIKSAVFGTGIAIHDGVGHIGIG